VRGRLVPTLLATAAAGLALVGCGGDDSLAPQAPGAPDMRVPEGSVPAGNGGGAGEDETGSQDDSGNQDDTGSGDATADPGAASTTTPDEGAAAAPEVTAEPNAAVPDEGGGAVAPDAEADGPTNDTEPPAGSEPEQFEDFCAQNPGAC
jgi:hypothetical protein